MSRYPWSVLGLEGGSAEPEIRRAYARRLKIVRPDTDPAGFQALVEARGHALAWARARLEEANDEYHGQAQDQTQTEAAASEVPRPELPAVAQPHPAASAPIATSAEVGAPEPLALQPLVIALEHDPQAVPQALPPLPPPATGAPPVLVPEARTAPSSFEAPKNEPVLLDHDAIVVRVRALLAGERTALRNPPSVQPPSEQDIESVLADLGRLPRYARRVIEPELIQAMAAALVPAETPRWPRLTEAMRTLYLVTRETPADRDRILLRRALFTALDDDYGWTVSDRRIYQALPMPQAVRLMAHLDAARRAQRIARDGVPPRWDGDGLPVLDAEDRRSYFGSELVPYTTHYSRALSARTWEASWRPWLLLLAPVWILSLRQYRMLGLWLVALLTSGLLVTLVERHVAALVAEWPQVSVKDVTQFATMLSLLPLAAVHVYVARNTPRLECERLARLAARADRRGLFDPDQRARYLRARAPSFRFKSDNAASGGFWKSHWFWIIAAMALVRFIGLLAK